LVTEIPRIVNVLQEEQPNVYGDKSAVTEAYMLFDATFGAGTVLGPLLSELAFETLGWTGCTVMLGFLTASAIVPVVSGCVFIQCLLNIVADFKQVVHLAPRP
jgi:hypothetical protein